MNVTTGMQCLLSNGVGGFLRFEHPAEQHIARSPTEMPRFWRDIQHEPPDNRWTVLFVSFAGGLPGIDCPVTADGDWSVYGTPAAACWRFDKTEPFFGDLPYPRGNWHLMDDPGAYRTAFDRVHDGIHSGEIYQLNLTSRAHLKALQWQTQDPATLGRFAATLDLPGLRLVSASPECFLRYDAQNRHLATQPIKGTIARHHDFETLRSNHKEHAEHIMVVDMCRNDLGRVCQPGSIAVAPMLAQLNLSYAIHLESTVHGTLAPSMTLLDALPALLPAASISGTPKHRACRVIQEVEGTPRGPYTGILGWIDPTGNAFFSVLIRTTWPDTQGKWWYGTGGGIVADSQADPEYEELRLKMQAFQI